MKRNQALLFAVLGMLLVMCVLYSCAQLAGGDVTETGNARIAGKVVDTTGQPVPEAQVMLLPSGYNPVADPAIPDSMTGITDKAGCYSVKAPRLGSYSVEIVKAISNDKALITGITLDTYRNRSLGEVIVKKPGAFRILLQDTVHEATGYVYLPGTTCYGFVQGGVASISGVPAGFIPAVYYANTSVHARTRIIEAGITVASGETRIITDTSPWRYSKKLTLNTTSTGAAVRSDQYDFPVLVRLNAANFDFDQAKANGEDLRFLKQNGIPLPYEIERWDTKARQAEVWVRVDTIFGNNRTQTITMYWGNDAATSLSNGSAVFDTARGFLGVWHLNAIGNAVECDATGNRFDGTPSDTAPLSVGGMIGQCRAFNGVSNHIRMYGTATGKLNFAENGTYTLSAWVLADTIDFGSHLVVGKGNEQYFMKFKFSVQNDPMVWEFVEYRDKYGWCITNSLPLVPLAKTWVYITGIRRGAAQYFFINGELVDSTVTISPSTAPRITADDVSIGRFLTKSSDPAEGWSPFNGKIDEVRITNAAYAADWIKLCYMNQKEQDALVQW